MNKTFLSALLFMGNAFTLQAQSDITVHGSIEGIDSGNLLLLAKTSENKTDTLSFTKFKAPNFEIKGKLTEPTVLQIVVEGYSGGFSFMAEPDNTYSALLKNGNGAYIKGGKLQDEWTAFVSRSEVDRNRIKEYEERYKALTSAGKYRSASAANDTLRMLNAQLAASTDSFMSKHDDLITAHIMQNNAVENEAGLEKSREMYALLGDKARNTPSGRMMKERIMRMESVAIGGMAPDFSLPDLNGKIVTMSKVVGKIKIIDFWASWCGPCRMNNPALRKMYQTYHNKGLEIISVSLDDKKDRWESAVKADALPWINVSSLKGWKCEVARRYEVVAVPEIIILDENNRVIATDLRGEKLEKFLADKLK